MMAPLPSSIRRIQTITRNMRQHIHISYFTQVNFGKLNCAIQYQARMYQNTASVFGQVEDQLRTCE